MSDITEQLDALGTLTTNELCERYLELFNQPVRTRHKAYLIRKIAWRIQALAEGDLSERARRRAAELANDADIRVMPPKPQLAPAEAAAGGAKRVLKVPTTAKDSRLPPVGTAIVRQYKGQSIRVVVHAEGFEYEGERYKTLTAVAQKITGSHLNGYRFFRLEAKS